MKKKIALFSAVAGVAGGLLYALEMQHRRNRNGNGSNKVEKESSESQTGSPSGSAANRGEGQQTSPAASMAPSENEQAVIGDERNHAVDDQGTDQADAAELLRHLRDMAFEASDEKLALALGRPAEEIESWTHGNGLIDGDVVLKARTLAMQRGFEV